MNKKATRERYFVTAAIAIVPGITAENIRECLKDAEGIRLSANALSSVLTSLEKDGVITTRYGGNRHTTWRKCWLAKEE